MVATATETEQKKLLTNTIAALEMIGANVPHNMVEGWPDGFQSEAMKWAESVDKAANGADVKPPPIPEGVKGYLTTEQQDNPVGWLKKERGETETKPKEPKTNGHKPEANVKTSETKPAKPELTDEEKKAKAKARHQAEIANAGAKVAEAAAKWETAKEKVKRAKNGFDDAVEEYRQLRAGQRSSDFGSSPEPKKKVEKNGDPAKRNAPIAGDPFGKKSVSELDISTHTADLLIKAELNTIDELEERIRSDEWWHRKITGMGKKKIDDLIDALTAYRLKNPKPEVDDEPESTVPAWQKATEDAKKVVESCKKVIGADKNLDGVKFAESVLKEIGGVIDSIEKAKTITVLQHSAIKNWTTGVEKWL